MKASAGRLSIDALVQISHCVVVQKDRFGHGRCAIIAPEGEWTTVSMWVFQTNDDKVFQSLGPVRERLYERLFSLGVETHPDRLVECVVLNRIISV